MSEPTPEDLEEVMNAYESHAEKMIQQETNRLQAEGPDEFPTGYYRHLAERRIKETENDE